MTWTTTPPTVPGWYWIKEPNREPQPVLVSQSESDDQFDMRDRAGVWPIEEVCKGASVQWAGPIPEPPA